MIIAKGEVTEYKYGASGNLVKTVDPMGNTTQRVYNQFSRSTKIIDGNGNETTYKYTPTH